MFSCFHCLLLSAKAIKYYHYFNCLNIGNTLYFAAMHCEMLFILLRTIKRDIVHVKYFHIMSLLLFCSVLFSGHSAPGLFLQLIISLSHSSTTIWVGMSIMRLRTWLLYDTIIPLKARNSEGNS
jgi:hypothetical protein